MSAAINKGFRDARHPFCGVFYVVGQLEGDGAEGASWDEFDFDDSRFFLFHVGYHLHFGEGHAGFWVLDIAYFYADSVFQFGQVFSRSCC